MIDLSFGFFWCGEKISYLRYLTFKTLRFFHPSSSITLYVSKRYNIGVHNWGGEKQDFEKNNIEKDYLMEIKNLDVNIVEMDFFGNPDFCPIFQTDLFRWWFLYNHGGFWMDMDQIVLKSFSGLPLEKALIYSQFSNKHRRYYSPTGVLGCQKNNSDALKMLEWVKGAYNKNVYNSSGPFVLESALRRNALESDKINLSYEYFYPVNCSADIGGVYSGSFIIPEKSYCLHWYGGHPLSQKFNSGYDEKASMESKDSISVFLRKKKII